MANQQTPFPKPNLEVKDNKAITTSQTEIPIERKWQLLETNFDNMYKWLENMPSGREYHHNVIIQLGIGYARECVKFAGRGEEWKAPEQFKQPVGRKRF